MIGIKHTALFLGGLLCGTAGVKLLKSRDARKVYVHGTAAAMRAKNSVMKDVTKLRENCGDIAAEARLLNEKKQAEREAAEEIIEDESEGADEE